MNLNSSKSSIITKVNYRDLMIFIIPILIFMLYYFVYNPGVLTVASYSQLHQIAADRFTTAQPIFYTYLVMLSLKFTNGVSLIGILQILVFSIMWTVICKYHRNDSSPSSNEFVIQAILTLIISLIPINAVYSITLSSNVLFSYSIMFLCFLIKVLIDKEWQIDLKFSIILAVTLAAVSGLNNYGIAISIVSFIVIIYYLIRKNTEQEKLVYLIGITIACILLIGSLNIIYDVKGSDYDGYTHAMDIPVNDAFDEGINLEGARNEFFSKTNFEPVESYENAKSSNMGNSKYNLLESFVNPFRDSFILGGLFNNPILYLVLSIALLVLIYFINPSHETYLLYMPVFLNVLINIFTGQNNLYSNLLVFYLIVVIAISLWFNLGLTRRDLTDINPTISKPEKIETRQIEPKQNPVEDNYYMNLESEIENMTLEDINSMLGQTPDEQDKQTDQSFEGDSDLIDQILKEIEMERDNK